MPLILSIETATSVCSVALHLHGQCIAIQTLMLDKSHSALLIPTIHHLLKLQGFVQNNIECIAISIGPGSYTGLRIATTVAQGLCYALDIPLITINTLEAMAYSMQPYNIVKALLCPMIDARRMAIYRIITNNNFDIIEHAMLQNIDAHSFQNFLCVQKMFFFGNGAAKCKSYIRSNNAFIFDNIQPSARYIGDLAYKKYKKKEFVDATYCEPLYL